MHERHQFMFPSHMYFFFEKIDGALEETFHTALTVYIIVPAYVSLKKPCIKKYLNQKVISISFSPTL